jgi:acyl-CoA thioester hydrolase
LISFDPSAIQFRIEVDVRKEEIDELDHVNNAVYLQYVEAIARAHAASVGLDFAGMVAKGGVFVVRRHSITYLRPAREGDRLTIASRIGEMRAARAMRWVWILRGDELLAEAETEWVWIDPVTRRPKAMPEGISNAFDSAACES